MQLPYLEALKDLPGYTPILKAVLKSQIQMLVEQLSEQTGEESVVITASVDDGTLCHLGSDRGRNFLDGREELKSQFLTHCISADDASQFPVVPDDTPRPVKLGRYGTRSLTSTKMSRRHKSKNIVPDEKQSSQHTRKIPLPTTRRKSATVSSEFHNTSSSRITSASTVSNVPDTDNSDIDFKYDLPSDNLTNDQVVSDSMIETVIDGDEDNLIQSQASLQTLAQEDKSVDNSSVQLLDSSQIKTEFIKSEEPNLEVTEVELGGDSNWNTGMVHNSSASELQIGTETESNQSGTDNLKLFGASYYNNTTKSKQKASSSDLKRSRPKIEEHSNVLIETSTQIDAFPVSTVKTFGVDVGNSLLIKKEPAINPGDKYVQIDFEETELAKCTVKVNKYDKRELQYEYVLAKQEDKEVKEDDTVTNKPFPIKTEHGEFKNAKQKIREGQEGCYKHRCTICYWRFRFASRLRQHMRLHTGFRFKCGDCDISYTAKDKLKGHCRKRGHFSKDLDYV